MFPDYSVSAQRGGRPFEERPDHLRTTECTRRLRGIEIADDRAGGIAQVGR